MFVFFFFKQKTAYEMRISDWSSDVCSSDLPHEEVPGRQKELVRACRLAVKPVIVATQMLDSMVNAPTPTRAEASDVATAIYDGADSSEERRVGNECVRTCRSRWSPAHLKKHKNIIQAITNKLESTSM